MSPSRRIAANLVCTLVVLLGRSVKTAASEGPPPVLNPASYTSPSGEYHLRVIPGDIYGRAAGTYVLSKDDETVWSGEKPYTLWEARVTDAGLACGYAYTHGWRGFARQGGYRAGMGDFHVVVLDAGGNELLNDVSVREPSRFLHSPPDPLARISHDGGGSPAFS